MIAFVCLCLFGVGCGDDNGKVSSACDFTGGGGCSGVVGACSEGISGCNLLLLWTSL